MVVMVFSSRREHRGSEVARRDIGKTSTRVKCAGHAPVSRLSRRGTVEQRRSWQAAHAGPVRAPTTGRTRRRAGGSVILIVLKTQIRPEKRDEWLAGIKQYTADVRQEPGNISFDYFENLETPYAFAVVEEVADADAGSAHEATD